jgi:hypothetical protein
VGKTVCIVAEVKFCNNAVKHIHVVYD